MKSLSCLSAVLLFVTILSCKKESLVDANQTNTMQMQLVADSIIQYTKVPGMVAWVLDRKRGIDWVYTGGLANIPEGAVMSSNHVFRIGSNTKTFTVTVLLQLVEEAKLSLTDPLSRYFPAYPKASMVTVAMLCNMTSGIPDYTQNTQWMDVMDLTPAKRWNPQELVSWAFTENFYFEPGTAYRYSNTNTILLGMIIEKITGHKLEQEIRNRIVVPLQLTQTGLITNGTSFPGPHSQGYYLGTYVAGDDQTDLYDYSYIWAAGSIYSTPRELQKYAAALVHGGLLSPAMQQQRLTDLREIAPNAAYGLGIFRRGSFYGHNGTVMGFSSSMYHSNQRDCTVIIYFNCMLEIHPDYLFNRFMSILYGPSY